MPRTLADRLADAIAAQQAEVARMKTTVVTDLKAAQVRLATLEALQAGLTATIEDGYAAFRAAGIQLDSD